MNAQELNTISQIADRAVALYERLGFLKERDKKFARTVIATEVLTVHHEIAPLRLDELLAGCDSDFAHDIGGIHRHLDHGKGRGKPRLSDCFMPRFAAN